MNRDKKINMFSVGHGVLLAVLIIGATIIPFIIGVLDGHADALLFQMYIVIFFHCIVGTVYSVFKSRAVNKTSYTVMFFLTTFLLSIVWLKLSLTYLSGDFVFGPMGLITLFPALIGIIIYEVISLIVQKIVNRRSGSVETKNNNKKVVFIALAVSLVMVMILLLVMVMILLPWVLGILYSIGLLICINMIGMALVDIVKCARRKWIPIVALLCINSVFIPVIIWLLAT